MVFRRPQTSIEVFEHPDQRELIRQFQDRINDLEKATGTGAFSGKGRTSALPPRAQLSVSTNVVKAPGHFFVEIQNPEYAGVNPQNRLLTPIIHQLQSSSTPDFSTDVKVYPPGVQTHYTITEFGSSKRYFQVRSSIDGKNFTQPVPIGPFQS